MEKGVVCVGGRLFLILYVGMKGYSGWDLGFDKMKVAGSNSRINHHCIVAHLKPIHDALYGNISEWSCDDKLSMGLLTFFIRL